MYQNGTDTDTVSQADINPKTPYWNLSFAVSIWFTTITDLIPSRDDISRWLPDDRSIKDI